MSTFNGLIAEFPDIRIDFFRNHPDLRPPLVCFLSHVHSDHLAGLESLRSPFVFCSAATREILLRLERFPCRINYAKGILEARIQTYKHLNGLLKPLPLETPTVLELEPGNHIQVTLFDANHCPGAVMFLIEGQGKSILYTGDIRSEPWFVNALARSPSLVEYTSGIKTLDTVYLDTSFTAGIGFQTKAEGIAELLRKVARYPPDTVFHFQAWTYGYEDVWIALSKALKSQIHVDKYKMAIYGSLVTKDPNSKFSTQHHLSPEAAGLMGFMCGNTRHPGCLTPDHTVRLHSCEKGNYCQTVQNSRVVWIQPIVARLPDGQRIDELGIGGGGDDLERDTELDYLVQADIDSLLDIICDTDSISDELRESVRCLLLNSITSGRKITLDFNMSTFGDNNEVALEMALQAMAKKSQVELGKGGSPKNTNMAALPNIITFPYSRHSSYPELCGLLDIFKPRDVWPCTVHPSEWLNQGTTIEGLFGDYCSAKTFRHDRLMEQHARSRRVSNLDEDSQITNCSDETSVPNPISASSPALGEAATQISLREQRAHEYSPHDINNGALKASEVQLETCRLIPDRVAAYLQGSQDSELSQQALDTRLQAFRAMLGNATQNAGHEIGLLSTRDNHTEPETELGES